MSSNLMDLIDRSLCAAGLLEPAAWSNVARVKAPKLYAGYLDRKLRQFSTPDLFGVTPFASSSRNIRHDIRNSFPLPDNSINAFQSEDVFEHLAYGDIAGVFDEIHRVLKPGALFRLSVPDYRCPILAERSIRNEAGAILFDPGGGGGFENGTVIGGGHLWFPVHETVKALFDASKFTDVTYLHYTDADGRSILNSIDYAAGHVQRTPDHDSRAAQPRIALSIVVDARK